MINSVSFNIINNQYINKQNLQNGVLKPSFADTHNTELSNYEVGQAILNRNNISFRNLATPIDVTDKYNKKTEGKDHLDLPNIHVYEYPDTNLQVFINEVNKPTSKNQFQASLSLYNQGIKNDSVIKKKILMELMNKSFDKNGMNVQLNEDNATFVNIDFNCNTSDLNKINLLNKLITKPNFSEQDLKLSKENLIKTLNSEKYQTETAEFKRLIDNSLLNSKEDTIKNIQNISLKDISSYYSEILNNTEAQYIITIDKSFANKNLYSSLNSDLANKFQNHSERNITTLKPISNQEDIRYYDKNNETFLTFHYPVQIKSNKDLIASWYLTLLEFFWRAPYIAEDHAVKKYPLPMELKNSEINPNELGYLNFGFTPKGDETISSTEEAITVFKALLEILYDEKLSGNTLESIKDCYKEAYDDHLNKTFDEELTHDTLRSYRGDIFQIYEILDDIKIKDIRNIIEQIMFEQKPIITINEEKNPYKKNIFTDGAEI